MRAVIQRSKEASVRISGELVGEIDYGLVILLGVAHEDTQSDADWLIGKIMNMRLFNDQDAKMNHSITEIGGQFLVVSQFTLHASTKKGNRPGFTNAAQPQHAIPMYDYFVRELENESGLAVSTGVFGAEMQLSLINDGPVTIIIDSKKRE